MTELEQLKADAEFMVEALQAGPSRYDQMTAGIYEIYDRHGFSREHHSPEYVFHELTTANGYAQRRVQSQIEYGNLSGKHFTQWRIDALVSLWQDLNEPTTLAAKCRIWYDAENDFHMLAFAVLGMHVEIRFYKVYGAKIDGDDVIFSSTQSDRQLMVRKIRQRLLAGSIGADPAKPGADHTAVSYLNENGNIAEV